MPRNGSGVYSLPAGSLVADGDPGTASQHNTPLNDLVTDANTARPVVAGGTGATTAADARTNLGLGNVATLTKQSSASDNTASRVLLVDAFGLGNTGTVSLLPVDNLNNQTNPEGTWRVAAASTAGTFPGAAINGIVVIRRFNVDTFWQLLLPNGSDTAYLRRCNSGVLGSWVRLLDDGDLSGTVSQSGGVPTGAIMEKGSNANGTYWRFASGMQVCTHQFDSSAGAARTWTFPAAFSASPEGVSVTPHANVSRSGTSTTLTSTSVDWNVWDGTDARVSVNTRLIAIGQWF